MHSLATDHEPERHVGSKHVIHTVTKALTDMTVSHLLVLLFTYNYHNGDSLFLFLKSTKLEVRPINMQPDTATDLILEETTLRKFNVMNQQ